MNSDSEKYVKHQNKTISELEALKKVLRKEAFKEGAGEDKRKEFYDTIKAISDLKAKEKHKQDKKVGLIKKNNSIRTSISSPKKLFKTLLVKHL